MEKPLYHVTFKLFFKKETPFKNRQNWFLTFRSDIKADEDSFLTEEFEDLLGDVSTSNIDVDVATDDDQFLLEMEELLA